MKKVLAVLLIAVSLCFVLSACGDDPNIQIKTVEVE